MGCLLAEFKLTAMLYGGRRGRGTIAFWVATLCTPYHAVSLSLPLNLRRKILERYFGSRCVVRCSSHLPQKSSRVLNRKIKQTRSRSAVTLQKVLSLCSSFILLIQQPRDCSHISNTYCTHL